LISAVSFSILRISNLISCSFSIISKRRWYSRSFACRAWNDFSSSYVFNPAASFVFSSAAKEKICHIIHKYTINNCKINVTFYRVIAV
jgi:hypothetical protein